MPAAKLTVAHFMDHGIVATPPVARTLDDEFTVAEAAPAPGETMTLVMSAAKNLKVAKTSRLEVAVVDLGALINQAQTPAQLAATLIKARHDLLGGTGGFLGAPETAVTPCPDGVGFFRHFKGGSIYWSPRSGAHEVHGLIRQKWAAMGWERSFLGYPTTDEKTGRDPKAEGRFNYFQGGAIFYHPQSGTFEVHGAILEKYRELGAEASILGYPTTNETGTPDGVGRFNHFQRGSIYWTPATWAHEIHGLIRNYWAERGWERNPQLGYPLTDELVPHRGIGHTAAPTWQKPILDLPFDVLKIPEPQPSPDFKLGSTKTFTTTASTKATAASAAKLTTRTASVSRAATLPSGTASATTTRSAKITAASAKKTTVTAVSTAKLGTTAELVAVPSLTLNPSIFINDHKGRSDDRYSDFEDGVLFWKRKTSVVSQLAPRAKSPSGTNVAFTAAQIANIAGARIKYALLGFPGASAGAATFVGTTNYSFDGAGLHNRAHRLRVPLTGKIAGGATGVLLIEVTAEISLDPVDREIVGYLTSWKIISNPGGFSGGGENVRQLHLRLNPALWKQFVVTKVTATKDNPIAILSVKTHTDGRVATYFEP